jgi:hypothetical protein
LQTTPELLGIKKGKTGVHNLKEDFHEIECEPGANEDLVSDGGNKLEVETGTA